MAALTGTLALGVAAQDTASRCTLQYAPGFFTLRDYKCGDDRIAGRQARSMIRSVPSAKQMLSRVHQNEAASWGASLAASVLIALSAGAALNEPKSVMPYAGLAAGGLATYLAFDLDSKARRQRKDAVQMYNESRQ